MKKTATLKKTGHRLSMKGYLNILRVVMDGPCGAVQVAEAVATSPVTVHDILRRMADLGLIHEVDWSVSVKGPRRAVYAFGAGPRAPYPGKRRQHPVSVWTRRPELMTFANAIKAMSESAATSQEIVELSGLCRGTVRRMVNHAQDIGLVHIGGWYRGVVGPPVAMYALGRRPNKQRPAPQSNKEACRQYLDRRAERAQSVRLMSAMLPKEVFDGAAKQLSTYMQRQLAAA